MQKKEVFESNKDGIQLAIEASENFRMQKFFIGSLRFKAFLEKMNGVVPYIFSQPDCENLKGELQQILPALLAAQDESDYILQADILESDIIPLLQKFQIKLQDEAIETSDFLEQNLQALPQKELLTKLQEYQNTLKDGVYFEKMLAVNGQMTMRVKNGNHTFWMHSTVNPEREAQLLVRDLPDAEDYVVFGIGLGYHVLEVLKTHPQSRVTVLETKTAFITEAFCCLDWTPYLKAEQLHILLCENNIELSKALKIRKNQEVFLHYPTIQALENQKMRETLEDFFMTTASMREQKSLLDYNFKELIKRELPECSKIKNLFYNKNVVIVGAGPSVGAEIEPLKKYRKNLTIFATGHILRTLVENQIYPDAVIITDPQPHMHRQVEGVKTGETPLILLSTAAYSVPDHYDGPVYLAYQEGYEPAERKAKECGATVFKTGGSVTTTALDIALQFHADKIIFVGVDLAYTDGNSHAAGVGRKITDTKGLRKVVSCAGGEVFTSKNLDYYRKWIERRISNVTETVIYNTGKGAEIAGTCRDNWENIIK